MFKPWFILLTMFVIASPTLYADEQDASIRLISSHEVNSLPISLNDLGQTMQSIQSAAEQVTQKAISLLGIKYKFGGSSPELGFDCSGLVRYVYAQILDRELPRTSKGLSQEGVAVAMEDLQPGDLVFFNTRRFAFSHVGIYLGNQTFLHAPSRHGHVNIDNISYKYWAKAFNGARRLLAD